MMALFIAFLNCLPEEEDGAEPLEQSMTEKYLISFIQVEKMLFELFVLAHLNSSRCVKSHQVEAPTFSSHFSFHNNSNFLFYWTPCLEYTEFD